jgi:hypothetical protein
MITIKNSQNLTMVLDEAHDTVPIECYASFNEITVNGSSLPTWDNSVSDSNGTSVVNIVAGPSSTATVKNVKFMRLVNMDTISHAITIECGATLYSSVLDSGDAVTYESGVGWITDGSYKPIKSFTVHGNAAGNFAMSNATLAERFAGNTTRHLFMVDLAGYTQVRFRVNKQVVGTAGSLFTAKYYTSYNTTVSNFLQLGLSSQVETSMAGTGYYDSGWIDLAYGARNNAICIGFTESGGDGVADPATGACDILFR